jgi:hypothetical protein
MTKQIIHLSFNLLLFNFAFNTTGIREVTQYMPPQLLFIKSLISSILVLRFEAIKVPLWEVLYLNKSVAYPFPDIFLMFFLMNYQVYPDSREVLKIVGLSK